MNALGVALVIVWASPASALGLMAGLLGLATGGQIRRRGRVLECYGGFVNWLLERMFPRPLGALAMTLGHVVLGRNEAALDVTRKHELVHVEQYERWGPLFIPTYLLCSLVLWLRGRDGYHDNPFEQEAYRRAP
jgi:hypothetical protein